MHMKDWIAKLVINGKIRLERKLNIFDQEYQAFHLCPLSTKFFDIALPGFLYNNIIHDLFIFLY
jgi:hypothetical protein